VHFCASRKFIVREQLVAIPGLKEFTKPLTGQTAKLLNNQQGNEEHTYLDSEATTRSQYYKRAHRIAFISSV
jgi:hypothetical protein